MKHLIWLALLFSVFPRSTLAVDNATFRYGLGIVGSPTPEVKAFSLRHEEDLNFFDLHIATEGGLWADTQNQVGRRGSLFGAYQLGVRPEYGAMVMGAYWGLAAISTPDTQLGGAFPQFKTDLYVGFQGEKSVITLGLAHISSAGIHKPNRGRDFIQLGLGILF